MNTSDLPVIEARELLLRRIEEEGLDLFERIDPGTELIDQLADDNELADLLFISRSEAFSAGTIIGRRLRQVCLDCGRRLAPDDDGLVEQRWYERAGDDSRYHVEPTGRVLCAECADRRDSHGDGPEAA